MGGGFTNPYPDTTMLLTFTNSLHILITTSWVNYHIRVETNRVSSTTISKLGLVTAYSVTVFCRRKIYSLIENNPTSSRSSPIYGYTHLPLCKFRYIQPISQHVKQLWNPSSSQRMHGTTTKISAPKSII